MLGIRRGVNRFSPLARALFARTGMAEFECAWGGSAALGSRPFRLSLWGHTGKCLYLCFLLSLYSPRDGLPPVKPTHARSARAQKSKEGLD